MKKTILILAIASTVIIATTSSCNSSTEKVEDAAVKVENASEDLAKAKEEFNLEYNKFKLESDQRTIENDKLIADLKIQKSKIKKEAKAEYDKKIADLETRNSNLKQKLTDYKEEGKDKWESFKIEFNHDMDELGKALTDFTNSNTK